MSRQQMIDVIITKLLTGPYNKEREDGIEFILRHGFKGLDNYSDEELRQMVAEVDQNHLDFLLFCSEIIDLHRKEEKSGEKIVGSF